MAQLEVINTHNNGPIAAGTSAFPGTYTQLASLASGNFTPGHTYLVIVKFTTTCQAVSHNTHVRFNGVDDPRFEMTYESFSTSPSGRHMVFCMGSWEAVAGHDIQLWSQGYTTPGSSGLSHQIDDVNLMAIDLTNDQLEGRYWLDENSTLLSNMDNVYANNVGASITFTPDGSSDYMVLGGGNSDPITLDGDADRYKMELYDSIDGQLCEMSRGPEAGAQDEAYGHSALWVLSAPPATARTLSLRFQGNNVCDHRFSSLFILKLNSFKSYAFGASSPGGNIAASWTDYQSESFTPASDKALMFGRLSMQMFSATYGGGSRIRYNGTVQDTSEFCGAPCSYTSDFQQQPEGLFVSRPVVGLTPDVPVTVDIQGQRYGSTAGALNEIALVVFDLEFDPLPVFAEPINPDQKKGPLILDHDNDNQWTDLLRPTDVNLARSELLNTAVLISLFTRRAAEPGDVLPDPRSLKEGWWADPYEKVESHRMGSRLWLLRRSKATQSVLNLAREYALQALQWMIEDGIAQSIEVEVERQDMERLAFKVEILKPDDVAPRWVGTWNAHLAQL